ncbi:MAG TPA: aminotransferase class I/II-fold pyridoxal phosphate-dependent enzyme [Pyrinomonadaceae bacterium]|nr:aminotransferase class I/II-fold pyridoxal phosphate-dependent enzyme [Pyrinomonadaceae bacterium]
MNTQSTYMQWAKRRPKVTYDLALSGILNLPFPELEANIEDIDLNGDNSYGYGPLVDALAGHCQVPRESVVTISGGTSMANHLAMAAAIEHGDEVLIEQPTYEPLIALAQYFGVQIKRFPRRVENGYAIDVDDVAANATNKTRLIVLTNLHNPSSTLTDEETLRSIGEIAASVGARVLVDEVYLEAMFENAPRSSAHLGPQFIGTSSLTKGYGLSGLRCGWILAEPDIAERMRLLHDVFGSIGPQPAERLSVVAMRKLPKFIARAKNILDSNRAVWNDFLDSREELRGPRSDVGTTSFPRLMKGRVEDLWNLLYEKYDTSFVPGQFFESPEHLRIGMCCEPELFKIGVERFGAALDELQNSN